MMQQGGAITLDALYEKPAQSNYVETRAWAAITKYVIPLLEQSDDIIRETLNNRAQNDAIISKICKYNECATLANYATTQPYYESLKPLTKSPLLSASHINAAFVVPIVSGDFVGGDETVEKLVFTDSYYMAILAHYLR